MLGTRDDNILDLGQIHVHPFCIHGPKSDGSRILGLRLGSIEPTNMRLDLSPNMGLKK